MGFFELSIVFAAQLSNRFIPGIRSMGFDGCLTQAAQFPAKTLVQFKKTKSNGGTSFSRYIILPRTQLYLFLAGDLSAMVPIVPIHPFFTSQAMSENQRPAGAVLHSASSRVSVTWPPGWGWNYCQWLPWFLLELQGEPFAANLITTEACSPEAWNHGNWIRGIIPKWLNFSG